MGVKLSLFLALMVLLPHFHCLNWQATGTLSYDMQNTIWNYINTNFDPSLTNSRLRSSDVPFTNFATGLSTQLNNRFDRAWNVILAYTSDATPGLDTILYGYGFRDHWFWYNGYKMNDGNCVTFIIWKDYNCQTYTTFKGYSQNVILDFESSDITILSTALNTVNTKWRADDPWRAAYSFVDYLQTTAFAGKNKAFTIILSQSPSMKPYAYVCALKYAYLSTPVYNGLATGGV